MAIHRRLFLRIAALGTAATLTGAATSETGADGADSNDVGALAYPDLLDMLGAERVCAIGTRYRELVAAERGAPALRAALRERGPLLTGLLLAPRIVPAEWVRRDFTEGHTVEIDGWILSITEARQCALYSLARG